MGKKRIQFTAGFTVDSTSYYQRVHDKDTGKINTIDNQEPLTGTSSINLETKPYKFTVERTIQHKTDKAEASTSSSTSDTVPKKASDTAPKKKPEYDTSQLGL